MGRLEGKVALITGAARGLGCAEAKLFAREGAKVIVTDVLMDEGQKTAQDIISSGCEAVFIKLDVTSPDQWKDVVNKAIQKYGKVDILVNNAGILISKGTEELSVEEWDKVIDINLKGTFLGCKYILPAMKKAGGGSIINTSSIAGIIAFPGEPSYEASKGGVRLLTKAVALDYAKYNIRVNSIHPGNTKTAMTDEYFSKYPEALDEQNKLTILKRLADPIEIAYGALFLASDESSYVDAAELVIDGGYTAV